MTMGILILTIQEGCDKFCKFVLSLTQEALSTHGQFLKIIKETKQLVDNGAKEITLLGQNVNAYNYKGEGLSKLISEISKIENLKELGTQLHTQ